MASKGFKHDPLADIALIRDNLKDRYQTGFQIIKELIQNSDDAVADNAIARQAKATKMSIGWISGLPDTDHPLLAGPGLVVVNDGPFKTSDAENIRSMGLSSKVGEVASIGKFGLGLKSIFHLCDAFFYMASDTSPDEAWDENEYPRADILNPWSPKFYTQWDTFSKQSQRAIIDIVSSSLTSQPWFCLWIPLRKKDHTSSPIIQEYPGEEAKPPETIFIPNIENEISISFPLLKNLRQIGAWRINKETNQSEKLFDVELDQNSERSKFGSIRPLLRHTLKGRIDIFSHQERTSGSWQNTFAGIEMFVENQKLQKLQESDYWPKYNITDPDSGEPKHGREKAHPHCSVYFVKSPKRDCLAGRLSVVWSVFLPVTEPEVVDGMGDNDFFMVLHGYFFVDAGRRTLDFGNWLTSDDTPHSELDVRRRWNRSLAEEGTFLLVLLALKEFVAEANLAFHEVRNLTDGIRKLKLFRDHRKNICKENQWIPRITIKGVEWIMVDSRQPIFELIEPTEELNSFHYEVFPALEKIVCEHHLVFKDWPRLTDARLQAWGKPMLKKLLEVDVQKIFCQANTIKYFTEVLEFLEKPVGKEFRSFLQPELMEIGRQIFRKLDFSVLRENNQEIKKFIKFITPSRRVALTDHRSEDIESENILKIILGRNLDILPIPHTFEPDEERSVGDLSEKDALEILLCLNEIKGQLDQTKGFDRFLDQTLSLIKNSNLIDRESLLHKCGDLKLLKCVDCISGRKTFFSYHELLEYREKGVLFLETEQGLQNSLQDSLSESSLVLVPRGLSDILFQKGSIVLCDAMACLGFISSRRPRLVQDSEKRRPLLRELIGNFKMSDNTENYKAIRYLLHVQAGRFDDPRDLLVGDLDPRETDKIWQKIAHQALCSNNDEWRYIEPSIARTIAPQFWPSLGIKQVGAESVVKIMKEMGPGQLDFEGFSPEERAEIFRAIDDSNLLRSLRIYQGVDGALHSIGSDTYIEGSVLALENILVDVTILRKYGDLLLDSKLSRLAPILDSKAIIEIILKRDNPSARWQTIMGLLPDAREGIRSDSSFSKRLSESPWLVKTGGDVVAPNDIIHIEEMRDDVTRVLSALRGVFVDSGALLEDILNHPAFKILEKSVFPPQRDALTMMAETMALDEKYYIGKIDPNLFDLEKFLVAFENIPDLDMPSYSVIKNVCTKLSSGYCEQYFIKKLLKDIANERTIFILRYLIDEHKRSTKEKKGTIFSLFISYCKTVDRNDMEKTIRSISLLNKKDKWRSPTELCVDAEGIDDDYLLRGDLRTIVENMRQHEGEPDLTDPRAVSSNHDFHDIDFENSAIKLQEYFHEWEGALPHEVIGGFLCLLGDYPKIVELAGNYLQKRSIAVTRESFEWIPLPESANIVGAGEGVQTVMSKQSFLIRSTDSDYVDMRSLLGNTFRARLSRDFNTILVDGGEFPRVPGHRVAGIQLRKIETEDVTKEKLSSLLLESARLILRRVYHQTVSNLENVWSDLVQSEQLDIRIAQTLILESAFFYLQQLSTRFESTIKELMKKWEEARHRKAEEDNLMLHGKKEIERKADRELQSIRSEFEKLIKEEGDARNSIVKAVREKIGNQYQYQINSIPFELFQNADDAYVEQRDMLSTDQEKDHDNSDFVVTWGENELFFMHWGRQINQFSHGAFSGQKGREKGYDRDLEKMLVLSSSDKFSDTDLNANRVTGKFGLGFKSVFLITDSPLVISGQLGFNIAAGFFPQRLGPDSFSILYSRLVESAPNRQGGTIFCLPLRTDVEIGNVIGQFKSLIPLLIVFSKEIKRCRMGPLNNDGELDFRWSPRPVRDVEGITTGTLNLPDLKFENKTALIFSTDGGELLLGLDPRGCRMLPDEIPSVWVTAPTRELAKLGFVMNGPFDLDVGRAQLARDSTRNLELAEMIGQGIGDRLCSLFDLCLANWVKVKETLRLAEDLDLYDFWQSLWALLADGFVQREDEKDSGNAKSLLHRVLWGSPNRGMRKAMKMCSVIPTELWGQFRLLTKSENIRYFLDSSLDDEATFGQISQWDSFSTKAKPGQIVSGKNVYNTIGRLGIEGFILQRVDLLLALHWEVGGVAEVEPRKAEKLGQLISRDFLIDAERERRISEKQLTFLNELLQSLRFRSQDGLYKEAGQLLIGFDDSSEHQDEAMRAKFAPRERVLNSEYSGHALIFFKACRRELSAPAKEMTNWILSLQDVSYRISSLEYIVRGELGRQVAMELRSRVVGSWLENLDSFLQSTEAFDEYECDLILALLGLLKRSGEINIEIVLPKKTSKEILEKIYSWWSVHREYEIREYEKKIYPPWYLNDLGNLSNDTSALSDDVQTRKSWLVLFLLGSFYTIGRTKPEMHRTFLDKICETNNWLNIYSDPSMRSEQWIEVVREYLDSEIGEIQYYRWLQQFVSIFCLANWLRDYVEGFLSINRRQEFSFDHILSLRTDPALQGGGPDAPSLSRVLGMGACFVLRELVRKSMITNAHAFRYCYTPVKRLKRLLSNIGLSDIEANPSPHWVVSKIIYDNLSNLIGEEKATFLNDFDIPLLIVSERQELQQELFESDIFQSGEDLYEEGM